MFRNKKDKFKKQNKKKNYSLSKHLTLVTTNFLKKISSFSSLQTGYCFASLATRGYFLSCNFHHASGSGSVSMQFSALYVGLIVGYTLVDKKRLS